MVSPSPGVARISSTRARLVPVEQPAQAPDEVLEDLPLVVLALGETQTWTGTQLTPGVRQSPVVGVDAERFVFEADVVGPRQQLRMGSLHVVALVERIDGHLPVGREHGREIRADAELVEVVRGQQSRQGVEVVEQRWRAGIEADPHEATPTVDLNGLEPGVRRDRIELVPIHDLVSLPSRS